MQGGFNYAVCNEKKPDFDGIETYLHIESSGIFKKLRCTPPWGIQGHSKGGLRIEEAGKQMWPCGTLL